MQTGLVLEYRRLRERDNRAAALERADATSTAILRAVSHDLRTPLATMRTAVDGLVTGGDASDEDDRATLVAAVDSATDQLERLIDNLLDLSRLQTGLLHPVLTPRSLEEILPHRCLRPPAGQCRRWSSRSPRRWCSPMPACSSGWSPTWCRTPYGVSRGTPVRVVAEVLADEVVDPGRRPRSGRAP